MDPVIPIRTSEQASLVVVPVTLSLLATVAVSLRVLARRISNRRLEASDYVMITALIVTLAFCAVIAAEPFTGAGMHMAEVEALYGPAPLVNYLKMTLANQVLWALSVCLPKMSVLLLYSRIFTMRIFVTGAKVTGALVLLLGVATILGALLQCRPIAYNWDQTIPGGHCGNQVLSYEITGTLNVLLDVMTLLLPMPYLAGLEMTISKKLVLIATFAIGLLTCVFSALRIKAIVTMDYTDLTFLAVVPSIYSVLEPTIAITLACVPLLRPLLGGRYSTNGTYIKRNATTPYNSGAGGSAARPLRKTGRMGFETLDEIALDGNETSSQVELRPVGPRYEAGVSAHTASAYRGALQLILALMGVTIYEHIHSVTLSLPLSPVLTFLTILLPVFAAANAVALPYLTRKSSHTPRSLLNPTHPAITQILQAVLTTVFATIYASHIVPGASRDCELSALWQRLFRGKNAQSIRAIQDAFECCGFRSVKDMAWPFPPAAVPCDTRFDRTLACRGPWTGALQKNAGVQLGVVVAVGLLQAVSCILARHYAGRSQAFSWRHLFGQGSRWRDHGSSSRPLLTERDSAAGAVDEEGEAGDGNGHGYGAVDENHSPGPRIEPSGLNEERNGWQDG